MQRTIITLHTGHNGNERQRGHLNLCISVWLTPKILFVTTKQYCPRTPGLGKDNVLCEIRVSNSLDFVQVHPSVNKGCYRSETLLLSSLGKSQVAKTGMGIESSLLLHPTPPTMPTYGRGTAFLIDLGPPLPTQVVSQASDPATLQHFSLLKLRSLKIVKASSLRFSGPLQNSCLTKSHPI